MWKLKQIFDGEYGCEERQPGEKEKCLVILANEEGEEKTFEANEDWIAAIEKLSANPLMKIIISKPMAKDCQYKKIVVEKKGDGYQAAKYTEKQVFHDNFGAEDLTIRIHGKFKFRTYFVIHTYTFLIFYHYIAQNIALCRKLFAYFALFRMF